MNWCTCCRRKDTNQATTRTIPLHLWSPSSLRILPFSSSASSSTTGNTDETKDHTVASSSFSSKNLPTFESNRIHSAKYTLVTFIPLLLWEQFQRLANVYFLIISAIQLGTTLSPTNKYSTILPLTTVICISAIREAIEDVGRHRSDAVVNAAPVKVLRPKGSHPSSSISSSTASTAAQTSSVSVSSSSLSSEETDAPVEWVTAKCAELKVGDIILLHQNQAVPADTVIFAAGGPGGMVLVDTASLDGETNLKTKTPVAVTNKLHPHSLLSLSSLQGTVKCDLPNSHLHNFNGLLDIQTPSSSSTTGNNNEHTSSGIISSVPLTNDHIILRGMMIRNTPWTIGMMIYAGHSSKVMLNARKPPRKRSKIDHLIDRLVLFIFILLIALCTVSAVGSVVWTEENSTGIFYLPFLLDSDTSSAAVWVTSLLLFNNLLPISLYVTLEIAQFIQAQQIDRDTTMLYSIERSIRSKRQDENDERKDTLTPKPPVASKPSFTTDEEYLRIPAKARTSSLNPSLGMVGVIVTDKTGTLTQNVMTLRTITAGLHTYGSLPNASSPAVTAATSNVGRTLQTIESDDEEEQPGSSSSSSTDVNTVSSITVPSTPADAMYYSDPKVGFTDPTLLNVLRNPNHPQYAQANNAVMTLALCHGVQVTIMEDSAKNTNDFTTLAEILSIEYQSASPDEVALVQAARALGYVLLARDETSITLKIFDQSPVTYEILAVNEFNSTRKRMSILLRSRVDNSVFLLTKGADSAMIPRIRNVAPTIADASNTRNNSITSNIRGAESALEGSLVESTGGQVARRSSTSTHQAPGDPLGGIAVPGSRYNVVEGAIAAASSVNNSHTNNPRSTAPSVSSHGQHPPMHRSHTPSSSTTAHIRPDEFSALTNLQTQLDNFASNGLRTLVLGRRNCTPETTEYLSNKYKEASRTIMNRDLRMEEIAEEMETDMFLVGATGIEDRLQDGVPETISALSSAGIRFIVCTGDKTETAINIGLSCALLREDCDLVVLKSVDREANAASIAAARQSLQERGLWRPGIINSSLALVIEGHALRNLLDTTTISSVSAVPASSNNDLPADEHTVNTNGKSGNDGTTGGSNSSSKGTLKHQTSSSGSQSGSMLYGTNTDPTGKNSGNNRQSSTLSTISSSSSTANSILGRIQQFIERTGQWLNSIMISNDNSLDGVDGATNSKGISSIMKTARHQQHRKNTSETDPFITRDPVAVRAELLEFMQQCRAVICSRVSPLQKAEVVRLVQQGSNPRPLVLAVGDGGNDVNMIQSADIGIGIAGVEGQQAVMASDYAIGQFRFLAPLLLVHGRNNYRRIVLAVCYCVYKNVVLVFTLWGYTFWNGFSGTTLYESYLGSMWNLLFTSLPIISAACADIDIPAEGAIKYPLVYIPGQRNAKFSTSTVAVWLFQASIHALAIGVLGANMLNLHTTDGWNGRDDGLLLGGSGVHAFLFFTVTAKLAIEIYSWHWHTYLAFSLSILLWFGFIGVYSQVFAIFGISAVADIYGIANELFVRIPFWLLIPLVPITSLLLDIIIHYFYRAFIPDATAVVQEWYRGYGTPISLHALSAACGITTGAIQARIPDSTKQINTVTVVPPSLANRHDRVRTMHAVLIPQPNVPTVTTTTLAVATANLSGENDRRTSVIYASNQGNTSSNDPNTNGVSVVRAGVTGMVIDSDAHTALQRYPSIRNENMMNDAEHSRLTHTLQMLTRRIRADTVRRENAYLMKVRSKLNMNNALPRSASATTVRADETTSLPSASSRTNVQDNATVSPSKDSTTIMVSASNSGNENTVLSGPQRSFFQVSGEKNNSNSPVLPSSSFNSSTGSGGNTLSNSSGTVTSTTASSSSEHDLKHLSSANTISVSTKSTGMPASVKSKEALVDEMVHGSLPVDGSSMNYFDNETKMKPNNISNPHNEHDDEIEGGGIAGINNNSILTSTLPRERRLSARFREFVYAMAILRFRPNPRSDTSDTNGPQTTDDALPTEDNVSTALDMNANKINGNGSTVSPHSRQSNPRSPLRNDFNASMESIGDYDGGDSMYFDPSRPAHSNNEYSSATTGNNRRSTSNSKIGNKADTGTMTAKRSASSDKKLVASARSIDGTSPGNNASTKHFPSREIQGANITNALLAPVPLKDTVSSASGSESVQQGSTNHPDHRYNPLSPSKDMRNINTNINDDSGWEQQVIDADADDDDDEDDDMDDFGDLSPEYQDNNQNHQNSNGNNTSFALTNGGLAGRSVSTGNNTLKTNNSATSGAAYNRFTHKFVDPVREKIFFRNFFVRKSIRLMRLAVSIAAIFALAYLLLDIAHSTLAQLIVRSMMVGGGFGFLILTCFNVFREPGLYSGAMLTALVLAGAAKTLVIDSDGLFGQTLYQMGILLVLRMRFLHALAAALIDLTIFIIFSVLNPRATVVLPVFVVYILFSSTFGAVSAWTLHVAMREDFLSESRLYVEEKRGYEMVSSMLPPHVVTTLRRLGPAAGDWAGLVSDAEPCVTIVFVDIQDFVGLTSSTTPSMLVSLLDRLWAMFDALAEKHAITKLETVGKEYVACAGLHNDRHDHATACISFASDVLRVLGLLRFSDGKQAIQVKVGINTGPVVAGIVGHVRPQFVLVGDTINVASRMSSSGLDNVINISPTVYERIKRRFACKDRQVDVKGKGRMTVYYVIGKLTKQQRNNNSSTLSIKNAIQEESGKSVANTSDSARTSTSPNDEPSSTDATPSTAAPQHVPMVSGALPVIHHIPNDKDTVMNEKIDLTSVSSTLPPKSSSAIVPSTSPGNTQVSSPTSQPPTRPADAEDESLMDPNEAILRQANIRKKSEISRMLARRQRREKEVSLHWLTYSFRDKDLEDRWQLSVARGVIPGVRRAVIVLAFFNIFRLAEVALRYNVTHDAYSTIPRPSDREAGVRLAYTITLFLFYLVTRSDWYQGALDYQYDGNAPTTNFIGSSFRHIDGENNPTTPQSLPPRITWKGSCGERFRLGFRLYTHAILLLAGGIIMSFASYSTRDACLDFIFYFSVTSNSQTLSFIVATWINIFAAGLFISVALGSSLFTSQGSSSDSMFKLNTTEIFFLIAGLFMCALAQGAVEFYRRHRFAVAFLFSSEVSRNQALLHRMLPAAVVGQLMEGGGQQTAQSYSGVCILFCDVAGFTKMSSEISPVEVIALLNRMFAGFETSAARNGAFKVQTIGDCFVCVAGIPYRDEPPLLNSSHEAVPFHKSLPVPLVTIGSSGSFGSSGSIHENKTLRYSLRTIIAGSSRTLLGLSDDKETGNSRAVSWRNSFMSYFTGNNTMNQSKEDLKLNDSARSLNDDSNNDDYLTPHKPRGINSNGYPDTQEESPQGFSDKSNGSKNNPLELTPGTVINVASPADSDIHSTPGDSIRSPSHMNVYVTPSTKSNGFTSPFSFRKSSNKIAPAPTDETMVTPMKNSSSSASGTKSADHSTTSTGTVHPTNGTSATTATPRTAWDTNSNSYVNSNPSTTGTDNNALHHRTSHEETLKLAREAATALPSDYVPFPELLWPCFTPQARSILPPEAINAATMLRTAIQFVDITRRMRHPRTGNPIFTRIGLHTGDVVGGVIGTRSFRYDCWGADVLTANAMETAGAPGGILVSQTTAEALFELQDFYPVFAIPGLKLIPAEHVMSKGRGNLSTYFVHIDGLPLVTKRPGSTEPQSKLIGDHATTTTVTTH